MVEEFSYHDLEKWLTQAKSTIQLLIDRITAKLYRRTQLVSCNLAKKDFFRRLCRSHPNTQTLLEEIVVARIRKGGTDHYLIPGRLEDVLSLIQLLAIDDAVRRSDKAIRDELQGGPRSSETHSWLEVAQEHTEFFRVTDFQVSLLARFVIATDVETGTKRLPSEILQKLIETAVDLHDTQVKRYESRRRMRVGMITLWVTLFFSMANFGINLLKIAGILTVSVG